MEWFLGGGRLGCEGRDGLKEPELTGNPTRNILDCTGAYDSEPVVSDLASVFEGDTVHAAV